jgi:hypothetical protein
MSREAERLAVDPAWQTGLAAWQSNPNAPTIAMTNIWDNMRPPGNLNLVAQVVGALYADHYWTNTQMDVNLLAGELASALGKNPADCQRAAKSAFAIWFGLLVRGNFADNGTIPKSGTLTASPDVLVNGNTPTTVQRLITMWNQYVWGPTAGLNYTYGRAASINIQVPINEPVMKMYVTDAGFVPPPNQWTQLFTYPPDPTGVVPLQNMGGTSTLAPGDRSASSNGFKWDVQGGGHYCLISVAGSEFFTNDPSLVPPSNWNSSVWIQYNGAAGWRNFDMITADVVKLKMYNADPSSEQFVIEAHLSNLEPGTEVSLEAPDKKLSTPLKSHVLRTSGKEHLLSVQTELPGNYTGDLHVRVKTPNGGRIPPNASIDVRCFWIVGPGHFRYADAVELTGDASALAFSRHQRLPLGNYILVGSL